MIGNETAIKSTWNTVEPRSAKLQNTRPSDLHTLNNNSVHCNISRSSKTPTPGPGIICSDNGHFSVARVTNSHTSSTPLYGHWLHVVICALYFHRHNYVLVVDIMHCSNKYLMTDFYGLIKTILLLKDSSKMA